MVCAPLPWPTSGGPWPKSISSKNRDTNPGVPPTSRVHPNIPFPGRPGSSQGEPGHFFLGDTRAASPSPAARRRTQREFRYAPQGKLFSRIFATDRGSSPLTGCIQISPSQGDPARRKVSRVTFFGASLKPFLGLKSLQDCLEGQNRHSGGLSPKNDGAARRCLTQTLSGDHIRAHKKSIPFPGNPGPSQGESGCFFLGSHRASRSPHERGTPATPSSALARQQGPLDSAEEAIRAHRAA